LTCGGLGSVRFRRVCSGGFGSAFKARLSERRSVIVNPFAAGTGSVQRVISARS
jgi:hypothetical protein